MLPRTLLIAGLLAAASVNAQPYLAAAPKLPAASQQQPAGPVWVVQNSATTQGPVWVVVDQRKGKPAS